MKFPVAVAVACGLLSSSSAGASPPLDAFLSAGDVHPLVEPRALSAAGRAAWFAGRVSSEEPRFGVPTFFWASPRSNGRTLRDAGLTPEQAARRHLLAHAELYRASPERWAGARVTGLHDLHDGTAVIVTFQQRLDGVRFFRDELKVIMNQQLDLIALSGYLTPATRPLGSFALTAESAVGSAFRQLSGRHLAPEALTGLGLGEGGYSQWQLEGASTPVRTRPVYFPLPGGVMPAWHVELELPLEKRTYASFSFVVSAVDGSLLYAWDLTVAHDYLVWADPWTRLPYPGPQGPTAAPHPTGQPNFFRPLPVPQQLVTLEHAGLSTNDPWLLPGAPDTRGNNVQAYADEDWPNGYNSSTDYLGLLTSAGTFSYPYNFGLSPEANPSQVRAGVVQLFYVNNFLHDWFYDDGFDEAGGNGQAQNFARGGAGNDPLIAEASDFAGRNNANMSTPGDGRSARMQMFVFGGWGAHDGTVDTGVVAHEWGHFISHRLIGDSNGLSSLQSAGMGEGWGDFHAALLLAEADDAQVASNADWQGTWSLAAWAMEPLESQAYYYGFRRYPLSADLTRNPLTFVHIADGVALPTTAPSSDTASWYPNAEVHNTGEVWAVMLWDCYVTLLRDPRFTFAQAQARMKRYLVAAYKATPLTPTFVEGRDALLAVAAANDPVDFVAFWAAFARRGLGIRAVAPLRNGTHNSPLIEDFTVGGSVQFVDVQLDDSVISCDSDGVLDRDERGLLEVKVRNLGTAPLVGAVLTVSSSTPGVTFPSGLSWPLPTTAGFGTATLALPVALLDVDGMVSGDFTVTVSGAALLPNQVTTRVSYRLNFDVQSTGSKADAVEASQSAWTAGADPLLDPGSTFRRFEATATQHFWFSPNPVATADSWLTSPPLQVGPGPARLTFGHRHDFERIGTELLDGAVLEVSTDDGASWLDVGASTAPGYTGTLATTQNQSTNPLRGRPAFTAQSARYPAFSTEAVDLSPFANRTIRVRFRVAGNDGTVAPARGWELDDLEFEGITNAPFSSLVADPNRCSNRTPAGTVGPDVEVDEGTRVLLVGSGTDADGDVVTLTWTQTSGPPGVLNGSGFTTPEVAIDTPVTLHLTVSDGRATSAPLEQRLTVKNVNRAPAASAPATLVATAGELVNVQGSGTDTDADPLSFEWTQVSGPEVTLEGGSTAAVRFVAPSVTEVEVVRLALVVRDALAASRPAVVEVTVRRAAIGEVPPELPKGCGCSSAGPGLLAFALAALLRRKTTKPCASDLARN